MNIEITIDSSEEAARAELRKWGIDNPGPKLTDDARAMLSGAEDALNEDPDVDANDRAHEEADRGYDASAYIKDTPEVFDLDDEGLAGENASPREKVSAAIYNLLSGICANAIDEHRPSADEMDWSDAHGSPGDVLIGKSADEGFVYVEAELRRKDWGLELSISGQTRTSGGQIDMHLGAEDFEPAPGWTREDLRRLFAIWNRWHLNGMNTACPHQRRIAERLGKPPHEVFTTRTSMTSDYYSKIDDQGIRRIAGNYGRAPDGKQVSEARVHCLHCDRDYGSTWLHEDLPADVVDFIERRFPATRKRV